MAFFDSPWDRRLRRDLKEMQELRQSSSVLDFEAFGDPPDRYIVTFKGRGLVKEDGRIEFTDRHQAEISLTVEYPRRAPNFRWLTPIHHPNIWGHGTVCLKDFWSPLKSRLVDAVAILWNMARLQILNPRSAYPGAVNASSEWAKIERTLGPFPVDPRPIDDLAPKLPEEPEEEPDIFIMGAHKDRKREIARTTDSLEQLLSAGDQRRIEEEVGDPGTCTNTAMWIRSRVDGKVLGYYHEDNPAASLGDCEGGHDFLLVDDRWLVDWWAWNTGYTDRKIFDLEDPEERELAAPLYGDPEKWRNIPPWPKNPFSKKAVQ